MVNVRICALFATLLGLLPMTVAAESGQAGHEAMGELRAYLAEAADNNPELKAAFARWKASAERAPQVSALPDPRLSYGYFVSPVETRTGPQRHRLGLAQTIPWQGKLSLKEKQAVQEAQAALARAEDVRLKVFYEVKLAFYDYAYLAQAMEIAEQNLALVKYFETMVSSRYASGLSPFSDLVRIEVELGRLEDRLAGIRDLRRPAAAKLNAAMNRPVSAPLPLPETVPVMVMTMADEELLSGIREHNPAIREGEHLVDSGQSGVELAEKGYYPDFTVGLETIVQDRARQGDPTGNGENPVIASMSVNIPLWQKPRDAAVAEATARKNAARLSVVDAEQRLSTDMELALYKYRDAGRKIDLYRDTLIPKAEQALAVVLENFQTGKGSSLDLIDTENTLLELELAYVRALADQGRRFAEMERILGTEIPCEIHGVTVQPGVTVPTENELQTTLPQ